MLKAKYIPAAAGVFLKLIQVCGRFSDKPL